MRHNTLKIITAAAGSIFLIGYGRYQRRKSRNSTPASKSATTGEVTFYVVRHGKTMLNTLDRVQGWSDAFLTPVGEDVVRAAGIGLKDTSFTAAYSSDSGRAAQTAHIILDENKASPGIHLQTDKRLREFNFGSFEGDFNETVIEAIANSQGQTLESFAAAGSSPEEYANSVAALDQKHRLEDGVNWPAEDYNTITARLNDVIHTIAEKESAKGGGNVLIVSHGLSIRMLFDMLFEDFSFTANRVDNASVSTMYYKDGSFRMGTINDLQYVEEGEKQPSRFEREN